ncbi:hypothetical protein A4A49_38525 [Nicotiana attenuata]|uniref:DUF4283 domain-containing protein n=1 Tax=Nicotiana attenuata TaxID=49451 RepID=A0A314KHW5_NICAT|nr:hypothetical protein A4A49_38525 [Nicotiana attenuata]
MVSKPTFGATVQTNLQSPDTSAMVEIQHGTQLGKLAIFFKAEDYFVNLAKECRFTIIGKFYQGKSSTEEIRKTFIRQFQLTASVRTAYFDPKHVYLDFANDVDYNHVFAKDYIDIGDAPMKILNWAPDFKPEEETSIVPVWILIHQLPWHSIRWNIISTLVQDVGAVVAPDMATYSKSRGNVAKVKVEIDLLKPRLDQIWLGHYESQYRNKIKDERIKAQKEAQLDKENEQKTDKPKDDGFQTVSKKKAAKVRLQNNIQMKMPKKPDGHNQEEQRLNETQPKNQQAANQDQRAKARIGIVINEPTEVQKIHMMEDVPESSFEDDGEEDSTEDGDYEDEMSTEESDEFESVYSEMEVNVSSEMDKIVERTHLSPRGRGRDRSNAYKGRHNSRGRGGRFTYQQAVVIPAKPLQLMNLFTKRTNWTSSELCWAMVMLMPISIAKIWIFWSNELNYNMVEESDQQVTCIIEWMGLNILVTSVYAKCEAVMRELWNKLRDISQNYKLPLYIDGDFNCIIDPSEKRGVNLHRMSKSMPMIQFIMDCDLIDPGFSGSQFIWCNGWAPNKRVWKRLDRVLVKQDWMNNYDSTSVNHLTRTGSDHSPLLTIAKNTSQPTTKYFRFLDFWTNEEGFKEVEKQAWDIEVHGSPMWKFHLKLKNTCRAYKNEEAIWKQKSGIKWFVEGEVNSKFFHSIVKGRRKRLAIKKIRLNDGNWIVGDDHIANEAISFFQNQFTREYTDSNLSILNCIPKVINEMDNSDLTANPTMEELKAVVFSLSPSSAPGPYGLSGKFYHS